jgi:iron(III) transport system substrate-binding protein
LPPRLSLDFPPAFRDPGGRWTGFAARARVILYNKNQMGPEGPPRSIADLAHPRFKDRAAMALPLFGTTATHAGALRAALGKDAMEDLFRRFKANGVRVVNGNAIVRDIVASGQAALGLTDSDDAHEAVAAGRPVAMVLPDQDASFPGRSEPLGAFLIPNTVGLVAGGPNPEAGQRLIEFLLSKEVEEMLAHSGSAQIPLRTGTAPPPELKLPGKLRSMQVDYNAAARALEEAEPFLRELFLQ